MRSLGTAHQHHDFPIRPRNDNSINPPSADKKQHGHRHFNNPSQQTALNGGGNVPLPPPIGPLHYQTDEPCQKLSSAHLVPSHGSWVKKKSAYYVRSIVSRSDPLLRRFGLFRRGGRFLKKPKKPKKKKKHTHTRGSTGTGYVEGR